MLKLVPFHQGWISHEKLDLHAIYRRPRYVQNDMDEWVQARDANGLPLWDLTGPLPVRQHNKWVGKGFEYVTLATRADLIAAGTKGTIAGNWREYDQHQSGGPWHHKLYFAGQRTEDNAAIAELREDVLRFGPDAVQALRRRTDPGFTLPDAFWHLDETSTDEAAAPAPPKRGRPRKSEEAVA